MVKRKITILIIFALLSQIKENQKSYQLKSNKLSKKRIK